MTSWIIEQLRKDPYVMKKLSKKKNANAIKEINNIILSESKIKVPLITERRDK